MVVLSSETSVAMSVQFVVLKQQPYSQTLHTATGGTLVPLLTAPVTWEKCKIKKWLTLLHSHVCEILLPVITRFGTCTL